MKQRYYQPRFPDMGMSASDGHRDLHIGMSDITEDGGMHVDLSMSDGSKYIVMSFTRAQWREFLQRASKAKCLDSKGFVV